jgi:DUF4097 and DUF4098 domain-containing protein YvlB
MLKLSGGNVVKSSKPFYPEVDMTKKWLVVGGLGIALLAVCAASVLAILPVVRQVLAGDIQWNALSVNTISADAVEEHRAAVDSPAQLRIRTPYGKVEITAVQGSSEIVVSAHKSAWGGTQSTAESLLQKTKVVVAQTGNSVNVYVDTPVEVDFLHIGPAAITVDFTVSVPVECSVNASSAGGDVRLTGAIGDATLHSDFGQVTADQIQGALTAGSGSGDVTVQNVQAATGAIRADSLFGKVQIQQSSGTDLTVKSSSGDVSLTGSSFTGAVILSTNFGDVSAADSKAGSISAETNSGKATLQGLQVTAGLTARSGFGDVVVKTSTAGSYDLNANSGHVTAEDVQGAVKAHSDYGDVTVGGKDAVLDLSSNSGSVTFTGSLGMGASVLHSNFGDIDVTLPADAQFHADLSTNFGSIHSEFPILATLTDSTHLVGSVGTGGPTIKASTNSGDVHLSSQPAE